MLIPKACGPQLPTATPPWDIFLGITAVGCLCAPRPPLSGTLIHMHSDGAEVLILVVFLWGLWSASRLGALYAIHDSQRTPVRRYFQDLRKNSYVAQKAT